MNGRVLYKTEKVFVKKTSQCGIAFIYFIDCTENGSRKMGKSQSLITAHVVLEHGMWSKFREIEIFTPSIIRIKMTRSNGVGFQSGLSGLPSG